MADERKPDERKPEMEEHWPTTPETELQHAPGEKSKRWHIRMERMARVQNMMSVEHVRVIPKDDKVRTMIGHPVAGKFRSKGSSEWPLDQFTQRRLDDGTVTIEPGSQRRRLVRPATMSGSLLSQTPSVGRAQRAGPGRLPPGGEPKI